MDQDIQATHETTTASTFNTRVFNQNLNIINNAVELCTAVIVSLDTKLIADTIGGESLSAEATRLAVIERLQTNLKIKD